LSCTPSPFCFSFFFFFLMGSQVYAWISQDLDPPIYSSRIARVTGVRHQA
jgi:hypothetical protein